MRFWKRSGNDQTPQPHAGQSPSDPPTALPFPEFPYHPDPRNTGSVVESDAVCLAFNHTRGYSYTGPVFTIDEAGEALCPWCIADGTAAEKFDAEFTDAGLVPADVPTDVIVEIARRTPGFSGWQQEHWLYHCSDGAAFLGRAGWEELQPYPDAVESLRHEHDHDPWPADEVEEYLKAMNKEGEATAYLFRCRHCGRHLA